MSKEKNIVQDLAESDPVISAEGSLVCGHTRPHGGADIRSGATFFFLGSATCLKAVAVDETPISLAILGGLAFYRIIIGMSERIGIPGTWRAVGGGCGFRFMPRIIPR